MKSQNIEIMLLALVSTFHALTVNAGLVGQQTEKSLVAGEELDLGCDLDVEDAGLVVWKHGDRVLFAGNVRIRRDYRMAIINKRLVITRVEEKDSGSYSCEAERLGGELASASVRVRVLSPARVTIREAGAGAGVTVRRGARLGLVCEAHGAPPPLVSWWAGDTKVTRSGVGEARLELDPREVSEEFTCRGDNGVGSPASASVMVTVLGPPEVALTSAPATQSLCSLDIVCRVTSATPASIKWWYNGLLLHSGKIPEGERSESLVIDVCGQEGEVVCEVENMMGLVRERLVMDRAQVTPQPLVSGAGGDWRPRPGQSALMAAAGAFVLLFV